MSIDQALHELHAQAEPLIEAVRRGVNRKTLYKAIHTGRVRAWTVGRDVWLARCDVDDLLSELAERRPLPGRSRKGSHRCQISELPTVEAQP